MAILTALNFFPIKSCAGIALREATLTAAGLMSEQIYDREWMVVDAQGNFMTQRTHPKMALITPRLKAETLELRAPGMLRLEIPLGLPHPDDERTLQVQVWNDTVKAYDCDETTAAWFSSFLGTPCRLVRFHPDARRIASSKWTGGVEAPTLFSDGYPVLVISEASLDDLNEKLKAQGRESLPMQRFRPNIVLGGVEAFEEDYMESFRVGNATLKPVKPCARCPIPSIDPATGEFGPDPLDILRTYRVNPKVDGGITFGMNAILLEGEGQLLHLGQEVEVNLAF
ncbi:MOSC domain-containing protein [Noviherbaspirillum autotrophicum]|uniref:Fe-S protein n=1 Tax=Noviherbaspirillum autotrophicum TaxID=709839 RepID=A0A0C1YHP6_9BURK|nr:MOSC N-terminal beta barrel domain-containing protein [Noviherbaspirillum autotrophicum]KIF80017.1 Fe-S protein [Noviherbaspirillum autotrophicum]